MKILVPLKAATNRASKAMRRSPLSEILRVLLRLTANLIVAAALFVAFQSSGQGFVADYEVRQGDLDGDSDIDLFIRERANVIVIPYGDYTIPIARPPNVVPFVLLQQGGQTFSLSTNLSSLNLANTSPSSVTLRQMDVNLDGQVDALLTGIGTAIGGIDAQIVFAAGVTGSRNTPIFLKPVDQGLKSFVRDVSGWWQNPSYFELTAIINGWYDIEEGPSYFDWWDADYLLFWGFTYNGSPVILNTEDPYDESDEPASCSFFSCRFYGGEWQVLITAQELTLEIQYWRFNQDALQFVAEIEPAVYNDDLVAGTTRAQAIADLLGEIFDQPVYGGVLDYPNDRLEYELGWPEEWLGDYRLGSIEGLLAQVNNAVNQPPASPGTFQHLPGVSVVDDRILVLEQGALSQVNAVVLHRTSGSTLGGALQTARATTMGTHYYVDKNGTIHQTASLDKHTLHVGKIKSKCIEEPSTCTTAERQAAQSVQGIANLHNFEHNKAYPDRYPTNEDSIGIEVVAAYDSATGTWDAPTAAQQQSINALVGALQSQYGLGAQDVYQHDKVSYKTAGEGAGLGF